MAQSFITPSYEPLHLARESKCEVVKLKMYEVVNVIPFPSPTPNLLPMWYPFCPVLLLLSLSFQPPYLRSWPLPKAQYQQWTCCILSTSIDHCISFCITKKKKKTTSTDLAKHSVASSWSNMLSPFPPLKHLYLRMLWHSLLELSLRKRCISLEESKWLFIVTPGFQHYY